MKITLEQLFYGRSVHGYGILGSSSGGRSFAARIESLCGAVGTPVADYNGEPFLLSVPICDRIVMLCGRRGEPDAIGRATLFFHALVADKAELSHASVDAFSLFSRGAFLDKMPVGEIDKLCIDVTQERTEVQASPFEVNSPCVIRSAKPVLEIIRSVVGENALNRSWATFAFQPMPDFDAQVLPPRVSCPRNLNEYDTQGRLICAATVQDGVPKDDVSQNRSYEYRHHPVEKTADVTFPNKSNAMFKLSVFANAVLAIVCGVLLATRNTNLVPVDDRSGEEAISVKLSDGQIAEIIDAYRLGLAEKFQTSYISIRDFKGDVVVRRVESDYNEFPDDQQYRSSKELFEKIEKYINFVNETIMKGGKL